jgi:alkanesulfonate monooxygenase SsuD/methylene tetrahydromethanopterin reductase-like flavin-dependent oxidoreductase (luciferase family)
MKRSLVYATDMFGPIVDLSKLAEKAGFSRVWATEYNNRDALIRLSAIASATSRIGIATGISYSFTRAPLALAAAAADLHELSGGRFDLGLGVGTKGMRTKWYGIEQAKPVASLIECASLLRSLWDADESVQFSGEFFKCSIPSPGFKARLEKFRPISIIGSGLNPGMLKRAGELDGVGLHPLALAPQYFDETMSKIVQGYPTTMSTLAMWVITSIDPNREAARLRARRTLAFYFSTPSYASVSVGEDWSHIPGLISSAFREHGYSKLDEIANLIPDKMLDAFCVTGSPDECQEQASNLIDKLSNVGFTETVFQTIGSGCEDEDVIQNCKYIIEYLRPADSQC